MTQPVKRTRRRASASARRSHPQCSQFSAPGIRARSHRGHSEALLSGVIAIVAALKGYGFSSRQQREVFLPHPLCTRCGLLLGKVPAANSATPHSFARREGSGTFLVQGLVWLSCLEPDGRYCLMRPQDILERPALSAPVIAPLPRPEIQSRPA